MRDLDWQAVQEAVAGGSVLACGGGGWVDHGYLVGRTAVSYGVPRLAGLDEVDPDALVVTVTAIGAPGAAAWEMQPSDYVRALELLMDELDEPVVATMTAQNGSSTTCNGWVQSAVLGTLVLDAAGDGRAHPTGKMGSIGLTSEPGYITVQTVAGGNRADGRYLETVARGPVAHCANILRTASDESGAICERIGGTILARGPVEEKDQRYEHAFDIGSLRVGEVELGFVNEYLTAEADSERLGTFPDVLTTLSLTDGRPASIANLADGDEVAVLHAPKSAIPLGEGVRDPSVYPEVEAMLGKPLAELALA